MFIGRENELSTLNHRYASDKFQFAVIAKTIPMKTKRQEEIDIMGVDNDSALFAECKWTNAKVDIGKGSVYLGTPHKEVISM